MKFFDYLVFLSLILSSSFSFGQKECKVSEDEFHLTYSLFDTDVSVEERILPKKRKACVTITDVNRLLYKCKYEERQRILQVQSETDDEVISNTPEISYTPEISRSKKTSEELKKFIAKQTDARKKMEELESIQDKEKEWVEVLYLLDKEIQWIKDNSSLDDSLKKTPESYILSEPTRIIQFENSFATRKVPQDLQDLENLWISANEKILELRKKQKKIEQGIDSELQLNLEMQRIEGSILRINRDITNLQYLALDLYNILLRNRPYEEIKNLVHQRLELYFGNQFQKKEEFMVVSERIREGVQDLNKQLEVIARNPEITNEGETYLNELRNALKNLNQDGLKAMGNSITDITRYIDWVENSQNYECSACSMSLKNQTDLLEFKVEVNPYPSQSNILGVEKKNYTFDFVACGGWKLDFSAGLAFHLGYPRGFTVIDDSYELRAVNDSTTRLARDRSIDVFIPTAIAMVTVRRRRVNDVCWGISVGAGTNLQQVSYYLGPSFLLGKEDMFLLSGGVVAAKKRVLKGAYEDARLDNESIIPMPIEDLVDDSIYEENERFRMGLFVSLTYSFSAATEKRRKEKFSN